VVAGRTNRVIGRLKHSARTSPSARLVVQTEVTTATASASDNHIFNICVTNRGEVDVA